MQGVEQEIQDTLVDCLSDQEKTNILTPHFLLGCSDGELMNRLRNLDKGGRLDEMLRKLDSCGFYNHYRGDYSPTPSSGKGDIVRFKKELDLGLSTPIRLESGQVIPLSSYIENLDPFNPLRSFLTTQLEKYTWEDEPSQRYYYLILKPASYPQPTRAFINL